ARPRLALRRVHDRRTRHVRHGAPEAKGARVVHDELRERRGRAHAHRGTAVELAVAAEVSDGAVRRRLARLRVELRGRVREEQREPGGVTTRHARFAPARRLALTTALAGWYDVGRPGQALRLRAVDGATIGAALGATLPGGRVQLRPGRAQGQVAGHATA